MSKRPAARVLGSARSNTETNIAATTQPSRETYRRHQSDAVLADFEGAAVDIACPICMESMQSLVQLNRHLDDEHTEVAGDVNAIGVRSWLQQISRGSLLAPVAAISKTLKLSEDFERNGDLERKGIEATIETDNVVTKKHWQKDPSNGLCTLEACDRRLGGKGIHCRKCGRVFCIPHTHYQMKLSRSAEYEPKTGIWCRVCIECFQARPWYNDKETTVRDLYPELSRLRKPAIDRAELQRNRLEKRLDSLLRGLAQSDEQSSSWWSTFKLETTEQGLSKQIVEWQNGSTIRECRLCSRSFSLLQGQHHCRLCGLVVCGVTETSCSSLVPFQISSELKDSSRIDIRICRTCNLSLFGQLDDNQDSKSEAALLKAYQSLGQYKSAIIALLPRFQDLVLRIRADSTGSSKSDLESVAKIRKRLLDAFSQYDSTAKKISNLQTSNSAQLSTQKAIHRQAANFLQLNMVPLQSMSSIKPPRIVNEVPTMTLAQLDEDRDRETAQIELMTFKEQLFLLTEQLASLTKRRRFDELSSLRSSIHEIEQEIDRREKELM